MQTYFAYCDASGRVGFGPKVPQDHLALASDLTADEIKTIKPLFRLAYDGYTLLVPGVPEVHYDQVKGLDAAMEFRQRLTKVLKRSES